MKISQNWLKRYTSFNVKPDRIVDGLTMLGLEVESFEDQAETYRNFVVGEVLERTKHPNADRLTICKVNVGDATNEIVCGAPNVAPGQKVAVALVGATIPHNQHDPDGAPFALTKAKIRGVTSEGMICSEYELGLGKDADGILVLDSRAKPGTPLSIFLHRDDVIYDIGITPNRADCLSHLGIAREISVLTGKPVRTPPVKSVESTDRSSRLASVTVIDKKGCPRYSARVVQNVVVRPSPSWLQDQLTSVGVRPINLVVDVTNFVMLETGQPLHAFDLDKLEGQSIVVRRANAGENFTTLDGKERKLSGDMLMICDAKRSVAIAGVMGGLNSEISDGTTRLLIESACFDAASIRRASRTLGLSTEASYRFERGVDIGGTVYAANRAAQMIRELSEATVPAGVIDVYPTKRHPKPIPARVSRVNEILGTMIEPVPMRRYLEQLGMKVERKGKDTLRVTPPSYRGDVRTEYDVMEEVARVYGYNNIETKTRAGIDFSTAVSADRFEDELRDCLVGSGFNEIVTISLQDEKTSRLSRGNPVKVMNPVSADMQELRTNLVTGALQAVEHNRRHGNKDLRLFEIGSVFEKEEGQEAGSLAAYHEERRILVLLSGAHLPRVYGATQRFSDFFDLKGEVEALLRKFCLDKYRFIYYDTRSSLTESAIGVEINDTYAGYLGSVKRGIAEFFDIEEGVFVCELRIENLERARSTPRQYRPIPPYPSVPRDLAFTVDAAFPQKGIEDVIRMSGAPLLVDVRIFDVYTGDQAGAGNKSLAYALEFQAPDHTLTEPEVEGVVRRIVGDVERKCNATLRR
ncbi:MAG TPA: phenylalanine--tRNA ligase subunit beta [Bacteroidota bacterium]|nr:phenylalanine--tRNA ligase subunit beta [Bacteroidota bacterium]